MVIGFLSIEEWHEDAGVDVGRAVWEESVVVDGDVVAISGEFIGDHEAIGTGTDDSDFFVCGDEVFANCVVGFMDVFVRDLGSSGGVGPCGFSVTVVVDEDEGLFIMVVNFSFEVEGGFVKGTHADFCISNGGF